MGSYINKGDKIKISKLIKTLGVKTDIGFIRVGLKIKFLQDDTHQFGIITEVKDYAICAKWYKTNSFSGKCKNQNIDFVDLKGVVEIYETKFNK